MTTDKHDSEIKHSMFKAERDGQVSQLQAEKEWDWQIIYKSNQIIQLRLLVNLLHHIPIVSYSLESITFYCCDVATLLDWMSGSLLQSGGIREECRRLDERDTVENNSPSLESYRMNLLYPFCRQSRLVWFDTVVYFTSVTLAVGKINTQKKALRSWEGQPGPGPKQRGQSLC